MKDYHRLGYKGFCKTHGLLNYHEMEYKISGEFFHAICGVCKKFDGKHNKDSRAKKYAFQYQAGQYRRLADNTVASKLKILGCWPKGSRPPQELIEFMRAMMVLKRLLNEMKE
jgi:hypothetical protein